MSLDDPLSAKEHGVHNTASPGTVPMAASTKHPALDAAAVLAALQNDVDWIHVRWKMNRQLYGRSELRVDLLNDIAPQFFHTFQAVLYDDVILAVARLTDRVETGGRENLVLGQLVEIASKQWAGEVVEELRAKLAAVDEQCQPLRRLRNRRIAHRDLESALKQGADLPGLSRARIESALESIREFMNAYQLHLDGSQRMYADVLTESDGDTLVRALKVASAWKEDRRAPLTEARLRAHKFRDA